jgi:hypothetical protein
MPPATSLTYTVSAARSRALRTLATAYQATSAWSACRTRGSWQVGPLRRAHGQRRRAHRQPDVTGIALILADVHAKGLKFGQTLTEADMDDLPEHWLPGRNHRSRHGRPSRTTEEIAFPGEYSRDARLCLLAKAPRPCTVLAALARVEHH